MREELLEIIDEEYDGNFELFMKEVVRTEDYGTTRFLIEELYHNDLLSNF